MMSSLSTENRRAQAGFTLVELAIVLVIVGLLIGGILKGQELIAATRVNSTVSQIKAIDASSYTFNDTFGGKPGDLANAGTKLNGCTTNNTCVPTSTALGDGVVSDGSATTVMGAALSGTAPTEGQSFFVQLGKAELIGGINSTSSTSLVLNDNILGTTLGRASHFRLSHSGTSDVATPVIGGTTDNSSQYLLVSAVNPPSALPASSSFVGITYKSASSLDTKIDDGKPGTGSVHGMAGSASSNCLSADSTSADYRATTTNDCGVAVKIMQ